ncbi:MAG: DMT family transporter, partial [Treponemataceae bacterium]|nr:DMT family transporter [Treponemataceae bacterium]
MNRKSQALAAVIAGNGIFGFSFLFSKLALQITIPSVLIATRFTVAFLVLNLIVLAGRLIKKSDGSPLVSFSLKGKPLKQILLLALFQPVVYFIAENYGIVYTSSAFAGIIIAVIPIAGIVLDVLFMHARVTVRQILCAVASVAGVAVTTLGAAGMNSSAKGLALLLVAVAAGALFYVFSKKSATWYSPLERTYVMFGVGTVAYLILAAVQCYGHYDELVGAAFAQPVFWGAILYLAVVSSVIAFLLLNFGSNYVSVSQATIFANFTTVISILAGVLVLHEAFTWQQAAGAVIILTSVYLA